MSCNLSLKDGLQTVCSHTIQSAPSSLFVNCIMVAIKKKLSRQKQKNVKGRTLHDILHVPPKIEEDTS